MARGASLILTLSEILTDALQALLQDMIYIGIDTGVDTGMAIWDAGVKRFLSIETTQLHKALETVAWLKDNYHSGITLVFEDARQRKWIPREKDMKARIGRAKGAGSVSRDAIVWEEFCKDKHINYLAVAPKNNITKLDKDVFRAITHYEGQTSNHGRDAAMLVFGRK